MLTPIEHVSYSRITTTSSKRNLKILFGWPWYPNRRHLMCRLPFLIIWTLIAIIFLYKSLGNNQPSVENTLDRTEIIPETGSWKAESRISPGRETRVSETRDDYNQLMIIDNQDDQDSEILTTPITAQQPIVISNTWLNDQSQQQQQQQQQTSLPGIIHQTSTVKKTFTEYNRKSKVCILLMQSASTSIYNGKRKRSPLSIQQQINIRNGQVNKNFILKDRHLRIPNHIRLLIEILESHRIDFTIETTRLGLPTSLLTDSDEISQFSVIVIDDFLKYTKLDRWMRDQLDRHCRKKQVGIVTFLNTDELDNHLHPTKSGLNIGRPVGLTTEESMADQFPLTLKPIDRRACKKQSLCQYEYKLNDQSTILRILKRKRDFVVDESLGDNTDSSIPWISMSSDHITYEPLTWARFKRLKTPTGNRFVSRTRRSTQDHDPTISSSGNNNMPSIVVADVKHKQDAELLDRFDNAATGGGKSRAALAEIGAKQGYSKYQLQSAIERSLRKSTVLDDRYNNGKIANHVNSTMMHDESESHSYISGVSNNNHNNNNYNNITTNSNNNSEEDYGTIEPELEVLSMFDRGLYDGIKRVIFGRANHHWLDRIILLEAIEHLSSGKILTPLERFIQIDIDDIFVGERGKRINLSDVDALIDTQGHFSRLIDGGFKFNLGFSGKYFKHGNELEIAGDEYLISKANHFNWFCHTWSHSKAHLMNDTSAIEMELRKNLEFAKQHQLPLIGHGGPFQGNTTAKPETYAVAPHHSGVYPVHEQLYDAWRKVLNVKVTSTEEYPSLRPASNRRGFVHKTIKVLPRQTCGLYTHTIYRDKYPGGVDKLEASIRGGELFQTILHNPVNIYMTHMSNYAHDRLALSTFSALIEFVQTYTNLQLKYAPSENGQLGPDQLANYYFNLFPQEQQPIWTNPCKDKRHLAIWSADKYKYCSVAPRLLIVGPQKTGTTALYSFLKMHPEFRSNLQSPVDFEEVQFFNDKHYSNGVDWYFSRFLSPDPKLDGASNTNLDTLTNGELMEAVEEDQEQVYYYFDKSATYYDDPKVARRAKGLLPEAKIVILLVDPADRAYSWYQHIKAHGDRVANSMSFEEIVMSKDDDSSGVSGEEETTSTKNNADVNNNNINNNNNNNSTTKVRAFRNRCLQPGYYSVHLSRWLQHFPTRQIIIIDGQWFRQNPASVMNKLQLILRVEQRLDYGNLLVFSKQKGFYCQRGEPMNNNNSNNNGNSNDDDDDDRKEIKCLGPSKGRKYPAMGPEIRLFLNQHYLAYNRQLARLLTDIGQPLPVWLEEAINTSRRRHATSMLFS